jgi:AAA family ATP:ADP antiporter
MFLKKIFSSTYFKINSSFDLIKIITLGCSIFLVMGAYTILKELKDAIFIITVGTKYLPEVKTISLFLMIPMVMLYAWLSGKISRFTLLSICLFFYGIGGMVISYFILDPTIGLSNTATSPDRYFGWIIYLFLEGCSPFLVSAIWSYFNSISFPEDIKTNYIGMTIFSKIGGITFSGLAWYFTTKTVSKALFQEVTLYASIMFFASFSLFLVPFILSYLLYKLPPKELTGYAETIKQEEPKESKDTFGFFSLFKNRYILGIFSLTFFWETVNVIFNNLRLNVAFSEAESISGITAILYKNIMFMHIFGFFFVLFGTRNILKYLGERASILLIPILTGGSIIAFLIFPSKQMIFITYIIIRAINYTLTFPVREALFIPTSKEIQFKTKSWIDSFGQKFSKGCGSFYNKSIQYINPCFLPFFQIYFFVFLIALWTIVSYMLGKKWEKTIKHKEIIS